MAVQRYLGLAEETSYNMETPPAAVVHLDIASASLDTPSDPNLIYGGGLQRSATLQRPGFYAPSGNIMYAFDVNSVIYLLKWGLGAYVFTSEGGTGTLNLHEFYGSADNVLDSFCARVGKDYFEHVFSGCVINSLELQVEGEFCNLTADIVAAKDSKDTIQAIADLSLPDAYPLAFHEVTASIDGSDLSAKVKTLNLSISNNMDAESGRGLGSRHPYRVIGGERETEISMELFFEDSSVLEDFWGGATGPAATGVSEIPIVLTFDNGAHGSMEITLPKVAYSEVQQQPSSRDEIVQSVTGRCLMSTITLADSSEVESEIGVNVENDIASLTA